MRYVLTILLIAAAAAAGYFTRELTASKTFETEVPFPDLGYSPSTFNLGCTVIMEGAAFEDRLTRPPTANARAGSGTEKLALKLSDDGRTLSLLYAFDVAAGGPLCA
jgi:hypothetical protein